MKSVRIVFHLMLADFRERARRYSFLITIGLTIFAAYLYLPSREANYLTLGLGNYRGVYNSAWIGSAMAVLCSALLSLPAFYLVKNTIERDEQTRVGQIIAATPLSRPAYTLGKAASNFVFLSVMTGVIALSAVAMQLIRAEASTLNLWSLLSPFVFMVLPAMSVIAALAVLFETLPWLRGTLGNVVYLFAWLGVLMATAAGIPSNPRQAAQPANDVWGVQVIMSGMMKDTAEAFPAYQGRFAIGATTLQAPLETFTWQGIHWTGEILLGRLLWVSAAIILSLVAALFFKRFDPAYEKPAHLRKKATTSASEAESPGAAASAVFIHLTPLASRKIRLRPISVLLAEFKITLKGMPWWWYIAALGLLVAGLLLPADLARQWLLPVAWLWPLPLWSSMGSRETRHATGQLIFSTPHPLRRQLLITWLVGILVAIGTGSGVLINLVQSGDTTYILAWFTGAFFIPSLALALGCWSGSNKLFEVVYLLWWYAGPMNKVDALNFMGTEAHFRLELAGIYWVATLILIVLAILGRRQQISSVNK